MHQDMDEEKDDEDEKVHSESVDGSEVIHKDSSPILTSKVIVTTTPQKKGHSKKPTTDFLSANSCLEYILRDNNNKLRLKCVENGHVGPFVDLYQGCLDLAIQSLDSLNDQIVQYIFAPKACDFDVDADDDCMQPKQRESLKASMALMRRLLMDAQAKFRKMVDDNKQLATRIDGDIQSAQEEVCILRAELADTNRRITELVSPSSATIPLNNIVDSTVDVSRVLEKCQSCSRHGENQVQEQISKLKEENEKLGQQNRSLQREVEELRSVKERMVAEDSELRPNIQKLETELQHAKDALIALKADRKRLKAEKFDLLNQMKQLYGTLEDKEKELREFIRSYEQRMKESDSSLQQQLASEKDEKEREKWDILKHAKGEAEKSVLLLSQLNQKDAQVRQLQEELFEARRQLSQLGYNSDHDTQTNKVNGFHTPTSVTPVNTPNGREGSVAGSTCTSQYTSTPVPLEGTPSITVDQDNFSMYSTLGPSCTDSQSFLNIHPTGLSRSAEELTHMLGTLDLKKKGTAATLYRRNNAKGTWGSISKVFSRSRSRRSMDQSMADSFEKRTSWSPHSSLCASPLTEETYTEKIKLLEEAQTVPMEFWKASTVLAWLEVTMGMAQYGARCAENIKSGKVLLDLNDSELEVGLGITNPMHRRKLRLAIEELRDPSQCKYPRISELSHLWICNEWLPSLGLCHYVDAFAFHLVDGRMLDCLSKKDLEKYLGIGRKFHQASIMHGVQFLRMVCYDRQILAERRSMCEQTDGDPLVWTNQRFIQWAQSIDLGEYAENLKDSGVHGALVVLEPSFTADTMATALGIPQTKNIIRRHLMTELESIVHPARVLLEQEYFNNRQLTKKEKHNIGSLGRSFSHSYAGGLPNSKSDNRRSSLRGSLTRALGLKLKQDLQNSSSQYGVTLPPPTACLPSTQASILAASSPLASQHSQQHQPHHHLPPVVHQQFLQSHYHLHHHHHPSSPASGSSTNGGGGSSSSSSGGGGGSGGCGSSSSGGSSTSSTAPLHLSSHARSVPSSSYVMSSSSSSSSTTVAAASTTPSGTSTATAIPSTRSTPTPTGKPSIVETHRRVKSSGDIETITVTPV